MVRYNLYYIYDNDVLVDEGTSQQIAEKYHISKDGVPNYVRRGHKLLGKYDIRLSGLTVEVEEKEKPIPKPMTAYEKTLDYLYRHLAEYGNTVLNEKDDPFQYLPKLEDMLGEKIIARKVYDKDDFWNYEPDMSQKGRYKQGRISCFFVLEVA
jgi:predicted DNA-binding protein YlxM (UPF0122 family)